MTIGENLRRYRLAGGWTQEALAHAAGVAHMTVSRLERDVQEPSVTVLRKLATALNVPLAALLD